MRDEDRRCSKGTVMREKEALHLYEISGGRTHGPMYIDTTLLKSWASKTLGWWMGRRR